MNLKDGIVCVCKENISSIPEGTILGDNLLFTKGGLYLADDAGIVAKILKDFQGCSQWK